ncbi:condensin complex subunit SMC2 [Armillaria novae-zelandiae]|uniref:Structural maintenance of chromosomes protein n=1 Tax=Armillaria novae-zelandiae TaxID=153914 RepID=A0AA39P7G5_9AGAR|nr:condensin complex subunit SMC2 [Armillaria novae-zelandiae]
MRIEELVLEGFKSYPVRTQITGWDPSFNAITGLNGSGKSNILDAIAFVLGITNMSVMRAANQQDLIYKRGQAGVTKASVTIVFDNSDRSKSPLGLEDQKQITVTRQVALPNVSKYLLNGHKAPQQTIQNLFQSVQLNINNPNFVIMQGRITKVLNMKPQEILGMVEEAAGTRMFEDRKDKAKKTMAKKEKRVDEITAVLQEEIAPKLDKLRKEKKAFLDYQKAVAQLELLGKKLHALEWYDAKQRVDSKEKEAEQKREEVKTRQDGKKKATRDLKAAEEDAAEVQKKKDAEMRKGGKLSKLEADVLELDKELTKLRMQVQLKESSIMDDEKSVENAKAEIQRLEGSLAQQQSEVDKITAEHITVKDNHSKIQQKLSSDEELLQSLLTGLSSSSTNTNGGGYLGQIAEARARAAQARAEEEQSKITLSMQEKDLKDRQTRWKEVERDAGEGKRKIQALRAELERCRQQSERCGWNREMEETFENRLGELKALIRQLIDKRDYVKQNLGGLDFEYQAPPNFDRRNVKGRLATLVSLNKDNYNKAAALEATAGGRLYNVVVKDEKVGKDLLTNGNLRKKVTIIPLNKIQGISVPLQKVSRVEQLVPGKAKVALSLVGYPDDVKNAMAYAFGSTFVCEDAQTAKTVTFNREIGARAVTLEGDVYEPSGTLSGGSASQSSGVLLRVQELIEAEAKLADAQDQLAAHEAGGEKNKKKREEWKNLERQIEMKEHELQLLEGQVGGSAAGRLEDDIKSLSQSIEVLQKNIRDAKEKQKAAEQECKKLQRDMDEFKNNKDGKIDELKASIQKQKAALQKHAVVVKETQKELQTAMLELEQMQIDINTAKATLEEVVVGGAKLRKELEKLEHRVANEQRSYETAYQELEQERATLSRFDGQLKELEGVIRAKKKDLVDADADLTKLDHAIQNLEKERKAAVHQVDSLEKNYEWILQDCDQFNRAGGKYDFRQCDVGALREEVVELENKQKAQKKKVNYKVVNMIDDVEKKETSLQKMLETVLGDKKKIEQTIEELDRYKRDALQNTWTKVSKDFGEIFRELLPGNYAKLQPPEGLDMTEGLEVKVQLGTVWKQSLTELSGGQRSLIALSLIMALLQFKPAPMYILDEIDAALDLSHTQHIGHLFRTRFKGSQFIVVSLKEGLFTNANVLFRARFRDGTSIVERTASRSGSTLYAEEGRGGGRRI